MEVHTRMGCQERVDLFRLVRGEIVENYMNLFAPGLRRHQLLQKGHELSAGVSRGGAPKHLSRLGIERREQRQRPVATILKPMPLGATGRERQHVIASVERLDRRLFVDTKDRRMSRRIQIQANDVGRFALEIRIVRRDAA